MEYGISEMWPFSMSSLVPLENGRTGKFQETGEIERDELWNGNPRTFFERMNEDRAR
jgi:hypothetical protein